MTFALGVLLPRSCRFVVFLPQALSLVPPSARAQSTAAEKDAEILRQMSGSFESLVRRVSPAVVEVLVTGYTLSQYTGEETAKIILKGEEKKAGHFEVGQGPDGKPVKTSLDPPAAQQQTGGRLKQRIVGKKRGTAQRLH